MLFSNVTTCPPILLFEKTPILFVEHHKHLGLTLSNNGKWYEHINNLTKSASTILGIMRNLKFRLKRDSLNQIYISFLRPILEYASLAWNNCTEREREREREEKKKKTR